MNIHPPLTAFPVALLVVSFLAALFEAYGYKQLKIVARVNLLIGAIFLVGAFISGYQGSEFASGTFKVANETIDFHHTIGKLALLALVPVLSLLFYYERSKILKVFYLFFFALEVGLVLYTGYLGGELVFRHGAGVTL